MDCDAAAEGAMAADGGAAQAAAGQMPAGATADAPDSALLRATRTHAPAPHAQVRHLPAATATLVSQAAALSLLSRRNDSLTADI